MDDVTTARVRLHAALADPVRLAIVDHLALSDRSPVELRRALGVESNLVAHHLQVLEDAGLVTRRPSNGDRRRRYVRLRPAALTRLLVAPTLRADGVVFVCTANSARSQLAAALWNAVSDVPASSAGTAPAAAVHPGAVDAARRRGLDLTAAVPSRYDPACGAGRVVVTVCDVAHEHLADSDAPPVATLHWSVADPATATDADAFDRAAAALTDRVEALRPAVLLT